MTSNSSIEHRFICWYRTAVTHTRGWRNGRFDQFGNTLFGWSTVNALKMLSLTFNKRSIKSNWASSCVWNSILNHFLTLNLNLSLTLTTRQNLQLLLNLTITINVADNQLSITRKSVNDLSICRSIYRGSSKKKKLGPCECLGRTS